MKNKIIPILLIVFMFFGCEDYLDLVPEKNIITIESIFNKKNTAIQFLVGCYVSMETGSGDPKTDPAMYGSDEIVTGDFMRNQSFANGTFFVPGLSIAEGHQNSTSPFNYLWCGIPKQNDSQTKKYDIYNCIRKCNIFIENVDKVYDMTTKDKERYKAEAKAVKAFYYFQLVKRYGPIVLVPENISVEADIVDMQFPRSPIDSCFKRIDELFTEAIPHMETFKEQQKLYYGFLHRDAAYAYRARACVFAASPLFNGNEWYSNFKNREGVPLFNSEYDPKKWERAVEVIDEAIEFCESQGHTVYDQVSDQDNQNLNTIRNIQASVIPKDWDPTELIHGLSIIGGIDVPCKLPKYNSDHYMFSDEILGCVNPSMRMVEMFYTENGLPIEMDKYWLYNNRYSLGVETNSQYKGIVKLETPVLNLHLKREPRFYANIAADKCFWLRKETNVEMNSKRNKAHGVSEPRIMLEMPQNLTGYWIKKLVPAECVGGSSANIYHYNPYPKMRMADLYLLKAEALNELNGPSQDVYDALNIVRRRAGIPDVEDSWRLYSKNPGKIDSKEGLREIIQHERGVEFAFEGHRFWDLRRWKKAHLYMNTPLRGWNVLGEDDQTFYNNYTEPVIVWKRNKFESPRDYFWPIRDEEVLKANIVQNPGW